MPIFRGHLFLKKKILFSRIFYVWLSNFYQFKITIREIIPENIKSFKLKVQLVPRTQTFFSENTIDHKSWNNKQIQL